MLERLLEAVRDETGEEPWACCDCDCTKRLEAWLRKQGETFKP